MTQSDVHSHFGALLDTSISKDVRVRSGAIGLAPSSISAASWRDADSLAQRSAQDQWARFWVRVFDLTVAVTAILVMAPVMLLVALLVKVSSPGPVLYGSPRLSSRKPVFKAWKFRSMYLDADLRLASLLENDPVAAEEYAIYRKLSHDPRITTVGRFIRSLSLDELPQLFNILVGEMSVVGPRPKLQNECGLYREALSTVLSVKPGLTGLWQVSGRNWLPVDERIALDLEYVRRRTLGGDVAICLKTFMQLWRPRKHGAW